MRTLNTIGVDFDDVLVPCMEYFLRCCAEHQNIRGSLEGVTDTMFADIFPGYPPEELQDCFEKFSRCTHWEELHDVPPPPGCLEKLTELKNAGFRLIVISAREHRFENITRRYLERFLPDLFDDVFLCNYYGKLGADSCRLAKTDVFLQQNCFTLLDDNHKYVEEVEKKTGCKCILFGTNSWTTHYRDRWERFGLIGGPHDRVATKDWLELDVAFLKALKENCNMAHANA